MFVSPNNLGFVELPGGDEHPSGDANQFSSILLFLGFWNVVNWRKMEFIYVL